MRFDLSDIKLSRKDRGKGLRLPKKMSRGLAELIGIHFGDGSMSNKYNYSYKIVYSCNIEERGYADYISESYKRSFKIDLKKYINKKKNCIDLTLYSKSLCTYLNEVLTIPFSPKNNLQIPFIILSDKEYLISFLRGLFDTDGCITVQKYGKYRYILIKICTKHKEFAHSLSLKIRSLLDISSFISMKCGRGHQGYDLTFRNKEAKKFYKTVGSNNPKNIEKWGRWEFQSEALNSSQVRTQISPANTKRY